jgi:hypothetical protein
MNKKTAQLATEEELLIDLTFHEVQASLITEFALTNKIEAAT